MKGDILKPGYCPLTVWPGVISKVRPAQSHPCNQPLKPGAKFCPKHEADRIRLGG